MDPISNLRRETHKVFGVTLLFSSDNVICQTTTTLEQLQTKNLNCKSAEGQIKVLRSCLLHISLKYDIVSELWSD